MERSHLKKQQKEILQTITDIAGEYVANWILQELRKISCNGKTVIYQLNETTYSVGLDLISKSNTHWRVQTINKETIAWFLELLPAVVYSVARQTGRLNLANNIKRTSEELIRASADIMLYSSRLHSKSADVRETAKARLSELKNTEKQLRRLLSKSLKLDKYLHLESGHKDYATKRNEQIKH